MPLEHSGSNAALKRNIGALMGEVGKSPHVQSRQQTLAVAFSNQRRNRASGGVVPGYDAGGTVGDPVNQVITALQQGATNNGVGSPTMGAPAAPNGMQAQPAQSAGVAPPPQQAMGPQPPQPLAPVPGAPSVTPMNSGVPQNAPTGGVATPPNNPMMRPMMASGGGIERADGGFSISKSPHITPSWETKAESRGLMHGPILSNVPGRTDNHAAKVPSGAYVLPAAHIASMGQGNSVAGLAAANSIFGQGGPYGSGAMKMGHGPGAPKPPHAMKFSAGGHPDGDHKGVDVMLSGGEFVVHPSVVRAIGKGSLENGHSILDAYVMAARKKEIETQRRLPPPAKD